ncbi:MAG: T9SS type A sorting domain-containing protein, partial [Flavobacterium sp.]
VFEWRNDGGTGTAPAGAVDNVSVKVTTCNPVTNLGTGTVTPNSAQLTWTSTGTAFDIEWGTTGFVLGSGNAEVVTNATNLVLPNLAEGAYQFYVRQDCGSETSVWAGPFAFNIGYCIPTGSTTRYITNFTTTGGYQNINNTTTSSTNGYGNYVEMACTQSAGSAVNISITPTSGTHYFFVWIDWNNDFDFSDAGETIVSTSSFTSNYSGSITVPAGQALGDYRMRIANSWSATTLISCGPATNGEYEDYTFSVVPVLGVENPNKMASFKYYPNPVANVLNLSYEGEITNVAVFNMLGQQVITKSINASSGLVDMSNLAAGNYIVKVNADGMTKTIKVVKQ